MAYIGKNPRLKSIVSQGDTLANLTAEPRVAGRLVYATDEKKFYFDNGTALVEVGSGAGGGVPLLSKGGIITSDGSNNGELTVGTDGQILSADSAEVSGLKWIDPPSGSSAFNHPLILLKNMDFTTVGGVTQQDMAHGNNTFVSVPASGATVNRSTDNGFTWATASLPESGSWTGVAYGNSVLVACSNTTTNRIARSTDFGATWSGVSVTANGWKSVAYSPSLNRFVAVANSGTNRIMYSNNLGVSWTTVSADTGAWFKVAWSEDLGLFVAVGTTAGNQIITSPDGITWTLRTAPNTNEYVGITYGNGKFVACARTGTGNRFMYSTNGTSWTAGVSPSDQTYDQITYGMGVFVACTSTSSILAYSYDGITFRSITAPNTQAYSAIAFGANTFSVGGISTTAKMAYTNLDVSLL